MLRLGRKSRAGISLMLGVLVGLALVILPGTLASWTQVSTTPGSNSRITTSSVQSGTMNNQPTGTSATVTVGSSLVLVGLVLFPAIAFSYLARAWTLRRAKARLSLAE